MNLVKQIMRSEIDIKKLTRKDRKKFMKELESMKIDRYYDVSCDRCGRSIIYDYRTGLYSTAYEARVAAFNKGYRYNKKHDGTFCNKCLKEME